MSELNYDLKKPFEYALKGETEQAQFITLQEPTFKQLDKVAPIKQAFMKAITGIKNDLSEQDLSDAKEQPAADDSSITAGQAIQLMYSSDCDMVKVLLHAEQLFKSGVALVDGEVKLTTPLMEKMDPSDFENLLGAYIANFIAPSLMDGQ